MSLTDEEEKELKSLSTRNKSEIKDKEMTRLTRLSLRRKFAYPEWQLLEEVKGKHGKMCDAIAYNLFPSRNFKTIGMEIKVSRSDWKKEMQTASKNDWFVGQCEEFYVVAGRKGIVKESELPEGWGLYVMKGGGKLYQIKESNLTEHQDRPMDREFFMRAIKKSVENEKSAIRNKKYAKREGFREGKKAGKEEGDVSREQKQLMKKGKKFNELKEKLDVHISTFDNSDQIEKLNKAAKIVDKIDTEGYRNVASKLSGIKNSHQGMEEKIEELEQQLADLEDSFEKPKKGLEQFQKS